MVELVVLGSGRLCLVEVLKQRLGKMLEKW